MRQQVEEMDDPTEREPVALADGVWLAEPLELAVSEGVVVLVRLGVAGLGG